MRLSALRLRGVRNLADTDIEVPSQGMALVGGNGQGKTNLLEAVCYPVLLRSFRGAPDGEVLAHGQAGFALDAQLGDAAAADIAVRYTARGRQKRVLVDGTDERRMADAAGRWIAVVFLPGDVALAGGPASERRRYLDRMLSLVDRGYLRALLRYRAALAQRNAALRQRQPEVAQAFEPVLAEWGALITRGRLDWARQDATQLGAELDALGEPAAVQVRYAGHTDLADANAWKAAFSSSEARDRQRGTTSVGPHRDDLELSLGGQSLRTFGSTGQLRSAAVALKLLELETLRRAHPSEPALVLDDVFAELDEERQRRLARRLQQGRRQLFVTAPRVSELPGQLELPQWKMESGHARPD